MRELRKLRVTYHPTGFGIVWTKTYVTDMMTVPAILMLAHKDESAKAWVKHNGDAYTVSVEYL